MARQKVALPIPAGSSKRTTLPEDKDSVVQPGGTVLVQARMGAFTASQLDDLRAVEPGIPTRAEMLRILIDRYWLTLDASRRFALKGN
jgi:hypothetical protein